MKDTVVILGNRLKSLMGNVNFRSDFDKALDSPEHLMAIGKHNLREYKKIEAMGEEHYERIQSLISNILAGALQEKAIAKYGNTDGESIRKVLYGLHMQPEAQVYLEMFTKSAKRCLLGLDLTGEQLEGVCKLLDTVPIAIIDVLEQFTSPLRLLPCADTQSIAMALADIMKEVET